MFLLITCSFALQHLLCSVHGQDQRTKEIENKNIHKETGEFHNQFTQRMLLVCSFKKKVFGICQPCNVVKKKSVSTMSYNLYVKQIITHPCLS